jgi:hypothetical protein
VLFGAEMTMIYSVDEEMQTFISSCRIGGSEMSFSNRYQIIIMEKIISCTSAIIATHATSRQG